MNHRQMVDLANVIHNIRPDWDQPGIISQLSILDANWGGTPVALVIHACSIAGDPKAKTPGALNSHIPTAQPAMDSKLTGRGINEPTCRICNNRKSVCQARHDFEVNRGIPDPHEFEGAA